MKTLIRSIAMLSVVLALSSCANPYLNGTYPNDGPRHDRPRHDRPRHDRPQRHDHRPLDEGMNRRQSGHTVF